MRYETAFETKRVVPDAPNHTIGSLQIAKRFARYLKGRPRCALSIQWATERTNNLTAMVDRDWAGCTRTRCSTSSGTQPPISLRAAVAEAKAITTGCAEGTCAKRMLERLTCETAQLGAVDRQPECAGNLTASWTWEKSNTS